jgi:hypothetical protein
LSIKAGDLGAEDKLKKNDFDLSLHPLDLMTDAAGMEKFPGGKG